MLQISILAGLGYISYRLGAGTEGPTKIRQKAQRLRMVGTGLPGGNLHMTNGAGLCSRKILRRE